MPDTPNVSTATEALVSVLTEGRFDYALIGGLAVILRGHDRFTQDVDVLVWDLDERLHELAGLLVKHGFRAPTPDQLRMAATTRLLHTAGEGQVAVDILLALLPFEREVLETATPVELHPGVTAQVASPEALVIMKLIASRGRDIADVVALKELYPHLDRERIRTIVTDYAEVLERPDIIMNLERWFS